MEKVSRDSQRQIGLTICRQISDKIKKKRLKLKLRHTVYDGIILWGSFDCIMFASLQTDRKLLENQLSLFYNVRPKHYH